MVEKFRYRLISLNAKRNKEPHEIEQEDEISVQASVDVEYTCIDDLSYQGKIKIQISPSNEEFDFCIVYLIDIILSESMTTEEMNQTDIDTVVYNEASTLIAVVSRDMLGESLIIPLKQLKEKATKKQ